MSKMVFQLVAFVLSLLGLLGAITATILPQWRSRSNVGSSIITSVGSVTGLWMECVWMSTGVYQCQFHRSLLAIPPALQAARAVMVISCVLSGLALPVCTVGMKCTRFTPRLITKDSLAVCGGLVLTAAGFLCLVTVSWTTNSIVWDFYNPSVPSTFKYEIGLAVYMGFLSSMLSMLGGVGLFLTSRISSRPPERITVRETPPPYQPYNPPPYKPSPAQFVFSTSTAGYTVGDYV